MGKYREALSAWRYNTWAVSVALSQGFTAQGLSFQGLIFTYFVTLSKTFLLECYLNKPMAQTYGTWQKGLEVMDLLQLSS